MDSLYTKEIKDIIYEYDWPKGLLLDIVEKSEPLPALFLRFYRENFEELSESNRQVAAELTAHAIQKIRARGCPCYFEVFESVPR